MKRKRVLVPVAMLSTLALAGSASASTSHGTIVKLRVLAGSASASTSHGTIVKLRGTKLGKLLANRRGHLLYVFAPDKLNKDVCIKKPACTQVWPPLTTGAKPIALKGANAGLLGTIKLPDGTKQVTYAGHPLYNWMSDPGNGDTSYVGFNNTGGKWYAINAAGHVVKH